MNISKQDIVGFSKVLIELGNYLKSNPDVVLNLLNTRLEPTKEQENDCEKKINEEFLNSFDLYKITDSLNSKNEILEKFEQFNIDELRYILKKYHLGGSKIKSKTGIVNHIIEYLEKRSKDVFYDYKTTETEGKPQT